MHSSLEKSNDIGLTAFILTAVNSVTTDLTTILKTDFAFCPI
jgi:hypothetical protein